MAISETMEISDTESTLDKLLLEHADNNDRLGFVRKVYAILAT